MQETLAVFLIDFGYTSTSLHLVIAIMADQDETLNDQKWAEERWSHCGWDELNSLLFNTFFFFFLSQRHSWIVHICLKVWRELTTCC